jgi:Cu-Zn family superoxide dismutase
MIMKSILAALPLVGVLLFGCDSANQDNQERNDYTEAPAPTLESEQPQTAPQTPAPSADQPNAGIAAEYAEAEILPTEGQKVGGVIKFSRTADMVTIQGTVTGLKPGAHGIHIHAVGDCSAPDASSAGDHFEPADDPHGSPEDLPDSHHVGDLGNITAGESGEAEVNITDTEIELGGPNSVVGKAFIVHEGRDDFETQPSGNSGARIGCGVIRALEAADPDSSM